MGRLAFLLKIGTITPALSSLLQRRKNVSQRRFHRFHKERKNTITFIGRYSKAQENAYETKQQKRNKQYCAINTANTASYYAGKKKRLTWYRDGSYCCLLFYLHSPCSHHFCIIISCLLDAPYARPTSFLMIERIQL